MNKIVLLQTVLALSLLLACSNGESTPNPLSPGPNPTSSGNPASQDPVQPSEIQTFSYLYQGKPLLPVAAPEIETLARLTSLPEGDVVAVSKHKLQISKDNAYLSEVLTVSRLNAQGEAVWSKGLDMDLDFNLGNAVVHNGSIYIVGTFYPGLKAAPSQGNPLPANAPISIGLLQINSNGEVVSTKEIPLTAATGRSRNVYQESQIFSLDDQELAVTALGESFLLKNDGQMRRLQLAPKTLLKTAQGDYLSASLKSGSIEIVKFNATFQAQWKKILGSQIKGINAISNLHPAQAGQYFLGFSINDLTASTPYGQGYILFDESGTIQSTAAHNAKVDGAPTLFAEVLGSVRQDNHIYLSGYHNSGQLGSRTSAAFTSVYSLDGQTVAISSMPVFETGKVALNGNHWSISDRNTLLTRNTNAFSFQLISGEMSPGPSTLELIPDARYTGPGITDAAVPDLSPKEAEVKTGEAITLRPLKLEGGLKSIENAG